VVRRKDQLVQRLQEDLRAAPKQEFVDRLEAELSDIKTQLGQRSENFRR